MPILSFKDQKGIEQSYDFTNENIRFLFALYVTFFDNAQFAESKKTSTQILDEHQISIGRSVVGFFKSLLLGINALVEQSSNLLPYSENKVDNLRVISSMVDKLRYTTNVSRSIGNTMEELKSKLGSKHHQLIDNIISNANKIYVISLTHESVVVNISVNYADIGPYIATRDCRKTYPLLQIRDALNIYHAQGITDAVRNTARDATDIVGKTLGLSRDFLNQFNVQAEKVEEWLKSSKNTQDSEAVVEEVGQKMSAVILNETVPTERRKRAYSPPSRELC